MGNLQVDYTVISNGSSIGQPQLLNPGELYAKVSSSPASGISIDIKVALDLNVFSIPSSGSGDVYIGNIKVRLPVPTWNLPSVVRLDMVQTVANSVSNLKASDSAPGGFTNFGFNHDVLNVFPPPTNWWSNLLKPNRLCGCCCWLADRSDIPR